MKKETQELSIAFESRMKELLNLTEGKSPEEINEILISQAETEEDQGAIRELCEDNDMYYKMRKDLHESGLSIFEWFRKKIYEMLKIENPNVKYDDVIQLENDISSGSSSDKSHLEIISEEDFEKCKKLGLVNQEDINGSDAIGLDSILTNKTNALFEEIKLGSQN